MIVAVTFWTFKMYDQKLNFGIHLSNKSLSFFNINGQKLNFSVNLSKSQISHCQCHIFLFIKMTKN